MSHKAFILSWIVLLLSWDMIQAQTGTGLVLSPVIAYSDSSFSAEDVFVVKGGTPVDFVGRSALMHQDKTQNQQFYWYQIKEPGGDRTGWISGELLAVMSLNPANLSGIKKLTGGPYKIGKGFEESVFYWGTVSGKDNVSSHFSSNNQYLENYLIFINKSKQAVKLPVGTESERGDDKCLGIYFADVTGDGFLNILLYRSLSGKEMHEEVRKFEVYQLIDNDFRLIYENRLNLYFDPGIPSPARFKFVDVSPEGIRVEYPAYSDCRNQFALSGRPDYVKCMDWISETYTWDPVVGRFEHFYPPASLYLRGRLRAAHAYLRDTPSIRGTAVALLTKNSRIKITGHIEKIKRVKNKKVAEIFLAVKTNDGLTGFLPSHDVVFVQTLHAPILNDYYSRPPVSKIDWKGEQDFVRLRGFSRDATWELTGNFGQK